MNPSINVSIAGVAFMLDAEAYKVLKDYTVRIELGYKEDPDGAEIFSDIEARIAELILSQQSAEEIVTLPLIQSIIDQLGLPDDLKNIPAGSASEPLSEEPGEAIPRRLYRNPEGAKLGGVCSGLATYFAVEPVMIRLMFLAPLVLLPLSGIIFDGRTSSFFGTLFGVSLMLYFILWFAIPKAKTPRQKLEMQGRKITVSNIHRTFQDEINTMAPSPRSERSASNFAEFLDVLGRIVLFAVKAFAILFAGALVFAIIMSIIATAVASSWLFAEAGVGIPELGGIHTGLLAILLGLALILPMLLVGYLLLQFVFKLRPQKKSMSIIFGIWVLILIFVSVFAIRNFQTLSDTIKHHEVSDWICPGYYKNEPVPATVISTDTIRVETVDIGDSITVSDTIRRELFME